MASRKRNRVSKQMTDKELADAVASLKKATYQTFAVFFAA
jgi:hypothetical protein